jgi:hypothetical protein
MARMKHAAFARDHMNTCHARGLVEGGIVDRQLHATDRALTATSIGQWWRKRHLFRAVPNFFQGPMSRTQSTMVLRESDIAIF